MTLFLLLLTNFFQAMEESSLDFYEHKKFSLTVQGRIGFRKPRRKRLTREGGLPKQYCDLSNEERRSAIRSAIREILSDKRPRAERLLTERMGGQDLFAHTTKGKEGDEVSEPIAAAAACAACAAAAACLLAAAAGGGGAGAAGAGAAVPIAAIGMGLYFY
jgi:hypothetical protein